ACCKRSLESRTAIRAPRKSSSRSRQRNGPGGRTMNPRKLFSELRRRNVIRMAGLYLVGAWLVVQVARTVLPMFGAPEWLPRTIVVLLVIGFVPAVIFSWVFELTPEGLKREEDVAPEKSIAPRAIVTAKSIAVLPFQNLSEEKQNQYFADGVQDQILTDLS